MPTQGLPRSLEAIIAPRPTIWFMQSSTTALSPFSSRNVPKKEEKNR